MVSVAESPDVMLEEDETQLDARAMRIFCGDPGVEATGTLMITSRRVVWVPSNGQQRVQGFSLFYQAIAMHAISRDTTDFPHPCLYVQLDAEQNISEVSEALRQGSGPVTKRQRHEGASGDADGGEEDEDEEVVDYQEIRLVPAVPSDSALDAMFKAMSEGAALNPDPDDGEGEGEDDEGGFYTNEDELLAGVSSQQLSMLERYDQMLALPADAADADGRFDDAEEDEDGAEDKETGQPR